MPVIENIRLRRAQYHANACPAEHMSNGDETTVPGLAATFTKGLEHDPQTGLVDRSAGDALVQALKDAADGDASKLDEVDLGSVATNRRKFVGPRAGLGVELIGADPRQLKIPPAPSFSGKPILVEIAENYWMALLRDVHFADYVSGQPLIDAATADLSRLVGQIDADELKFPVMSGRVTPSVLFRGFTPTDRVGPWLSQFLWLPAPFGAQTIDQRMQTRVAGADYMTTWDHWHAVQQGVRPSDGAMDPQPRYIRSGRDIAEWVHVDALYQAYFNACLILLGYKKPGAGGLAPAVSSSNPYVQSGGHNRNQEPFATFGGPHILSLLTEVATRALKAVWFQKWYVHRRFRPEVFAARFEAVRTNRLASDALPFHAEWEALLGNVQERVLATNGNWLLPMAFPEGSPLHPAYGAGHATVAGACTTILKAWFDEKTRLVDLIDPFTHRHLVPVIASRDGLSLDRYEGADAGAMTIGGELNKIAANIGVGRNVAGVHWRTDHTASVRLGEAVAKATLEDYVDTFNETGDGFHFTSFDGEQIRIPPHAGGGSAMKTAAE